METDFDADAEVAWAKEIETRLTAVAQGNFVAQEWDEALADIRQELSQVKPP